MPLLALDCRDQNRTSSASSRAQARLGIIEAVVTMVGIEAITMVGVATMPGAAIAVVTGLAVSTER